MTDPERRLGRRRLAALVVLALLLLLPVGGGNVRRAAAAPEPPRPPRPLVTDPDAVFAVPRVARPAYLTPFTDPTFGTTLTRITDDPGSRLVPARGGAGVWGRDARHNYHTNQPWNADGTLLYLENKTTAGGYPGQLYLDGSTYAGRFGTPPHLPGRGSYDQRWHPGPAHANEIIVAGKGTTTLSWFDVVRDEVTRRWDLPMPVTYLGNTYGNPSQDGRLIALGDATHLFLLDMDPRPPHASYPAARVGPVYDFGSEGVPGVVNWYTVSPSGRFVVVHYRGDALRVFDVNPGTLAVTPRAMTASYPGVAGDPARGFVYDLGHPDLALNPFDHDEDVILGQEHADNVGKKVPGVRTVNGAGVGHVVLVRLRDGAVTSLTDPGDRAGVPKEAYASHVSCRNVGRPGWCYVCYYPGAGERYDDEVLAVKLDGSGAVERFAAHHSDFENFTGRTRRYATAAPDFDYRSEPHAVPSPDGRRVLFASNWVDRGNGGDAIQAYVIDAGR
jgi:hypothetical protein